jgi:hypothetical protein
MLKYRGGRVLGRISLVCLLEMMVWCQQQYDNLDRQAGDLQVNSSCELPRIDKLSLVSAPRLPACVQVAILYQS